MYFKINAITTRVFLLLVLLVNGLYFNARGSDPGKKNTFKEIESGFKNIPDSVQTSVYWYWISDNVSEEGVVKDLYSMKEAGINRAFIGNIGLSDVPYGKVKMLSEEWWKIVHAALKTATKLNIEIGIFNSPGWSQSGGPWIKPEEAMRYLISSETRITGPRKVSQKLKKPIDIYQDVKVIAYPAPLDDQLVLNSKNGIISSLPKVADLSNISDDNKNTGISFPAGKEFTVNFEAKEPFTARSLSIQTTEKPMLAKAILQFKAVDGTYRSLSEFEINRSNPALNVGFKPYAPVVVSFSATTATSFRLIIKNINPNCGLAEVTLSTAPRVERYAEKTLAKMFQTPLPYWHEYQWAPQAEVDDLATVIDGSKVIDLSNYLTADAQMICRDL